MSTWYLKKPDGTEYGPVDWTALTSWAADGRVEAADLVSDNRVDWQKPSDLPDLEMNLMVKLADGSAYGPIHILFLATLLQDQAIPADASVDRLSDNYRASAITHVIRHFSAKPATIAQPQEDLVAAAKLEEAHQRARETEGLLEAARKQAETMAKLKDELEAQLKDRDAQNRELNQRLTAQAKEMDALEESLNTAEVANIEKTGTFIGSNPYQKEVEKWRGLYAEQQDQTRADQAAAKEQIYRLQSDLQEAHTHLERSARRILQLERSVKALEEIRSLDSNTIGLAAETALQDSLVSLTENYETLLRQLDEKNALLEELKQERNAAEDRAQSRLHHAEETSRRDRRELDAAQSRLKELEEAHMSLVRSFRDLNDRFIRMRQSVPLPENA